MFHRVIPGFMIQGGDPNTKDPNNEKLQWGMGGPGYTQLKENSVQDHIYKELYLWRDHTDPNSAGSQFFIVTSG